MSYFNQEDQQALAHDASQIGDSHLQQVYDKFYQLHKTLHPRLRDHNCDLHPHYKNSAIVTSTSVASLTPAHTLTLHYLRSQEQAQLVERLMGRDSTNWHSDVEAYRHPVIEVRLTPNHFVVELVLSPAAWWDQRNFVGKMVLPRHREAFRSLLLKMPGDFRCGFWDGTELSEMHLMTQQLGRGTNLYDWMSTFADGQDWLRIGAWYEPQDMALEPNRIISEMVQRVGSLYKLYTFILWTSNNNFHSFYGKGRGKNSDARL